MSRWGYPLCLVLLAAAGGLAWWAGAAAFGLIALAAVAGVVATRTVGRRLIAIIVVASAVGAVLQVQAYPAAVLMIVASVGVFVLAPTWPVLGTRFDRTPSEDPWAQLDRGQDPTVS